MKPLLSIIIIAGNEQEVIADCLKSILDLPSEIILVASNSTDNTKSIAKSIIPKIKIIGTNDSYGRNFSKWRNLGFKAATTPWIFYIDADERSTKLLNAEILATIKNNIGSNYYVIPRANYFLGQRVIHGGTYPDYVKRLYHKSSFMGYEGILHEEPIVTGQLTYLTNDLLHFTHRDLYSMINKTIIWTDMEAKALYDSGHPPIVWWRIIRMMLTKFYERLIKQQMWRDGTVGWISAIFESFDTFIIYSRLWELQQHD